MNNNLCIICRRYSYCSCSSGESQITHAVLWINILTIPAFLTVSFGFLHWLGDSARWSHSCNNRIHGAPGPVIRDPSHSDGKPECPPRVSSTGEIDASKFTLHILSDTPRGSQRRKYILLMKYSDVSSKLFFPRLFQDSTTCPELGSLPLFPVDPRSLFGQLFLRQQLWSYVCGDIVHIIFDNHWVRKTLGYLGSTPLFAIYDKIAESSDDCLMCKLRIYQSVRTHIVCIDISETRK